jgi:hypothetical protein
VCACGRERGRERERKRERERESERGVCQTSESKTPNTQVVRLVEQAIQSCAIASHGCEATQRQTDKQTETGIQVETDGDREAVILFV